MAADGGFPTRDVVLTWIGRLLCLLVLMPLACRAATAVEAGTVVSSNGDTWLMRDGSISSPLRDGATVYGGDKLVTGPDARIEVRFVDNARIAIGPGSEFRVDEYRFDSGGERSFFTLARGVIRQISGAIGKRNHDDYRLTTPTGVLAIRGTEFVARETVCPCLDDRQAGLAVDVIAGRVEVTNRSGSVDVPAGSAILMGSATMPAVFTAGPRAPRGARSNGAVPSGAGAAGAGTSGRASDGRAVEPGAPSGAAPQGSEPVVPRIP